VPPDVRFSRLECTKFAFRWGVAPNPTVRVYSTPLAAFKGPTSNRRERKRKGEEGKVKGRRGEGSDLAHTKILAWRPYVTAYFFFCSRNDIVSDY